MPHRTSDGMTPLTEARLTQHNHLIENVRTGLFVNSHTYTDYQRIPTNNSHAAKVIEQERTHQTIVEHGQRAGYDLDLNEKSIPDGDVVTKMHTTTITSCPLELFNIPCQATYESPLERFLTPDGCSDPTYFARPTLKQQFGDMNSTATRRRQAEREMEIIGRVGEANKGSTHG
ncbi:hypothetical protein BGW36DRAFT_430041 [Talaromyces proteolyticus]|uniref:Uncharacterized protein n=1 Tax=Talaromyces proteolyticus TaxID=1131652 RepID=A0AAD4KLC1_9EURO|nr:uncharacterized protein BGW36DRAFT_430041 [Talaromyces proteolyticus]KAH8694018.1 hypothetical protein BGW36DRAFT_430041 [Talaromyces proteolyticus]